MKKSQNVSSAIALGISVFLALPLAATEPAHVHGTQCVRVHELPADHPLQLARQRLEARVASPDGPSLKTGKFGLEGGNITCRVVGKEPNYHWECESSDALFQKGATDSKTWATLDLVVWLRDSWVKAHGGEAPARERLQAALGTANRMFARSNTRIQLRAPYVVRFRDDEVTDDDSYLLTARFGADFVTIFADVSDRLNIRGCKVNGCAYATMNGSSQFMAGGRYPGGWDATSAWSVISDVAGEYGSVSADGRIVQLVSDVGGMLAHELSHNMGADHFVPTYTTHFPYSKGYLAEVTIEELRKYPYCGDLTTGGVGTFSNPDLICGGRPRGIPNEADAARAFRESRFEFASFSKMTKRIEGNFTGMWWTPSERGVGWTFTHQDDLLFGVWYTYDFGGNPMWLVASELRRLSDDSFQGALFRVKRGQPFQTVNGRPVVNNADIEEVGTMAVSFNDASWGQASFEITIDGKVYRDSKWLTRLNFQANPPTCVSTTQSRASATNYQDLWWAESEPGWGMHASHEANVIFAAWYNYGAGGAPEWRVASAMERQPDGSYYGAVYATKGLPLDSIGGRIFELDWSAASNLASRIPRDVASSVMPTGTARLAFQDGERGTLTYVSDGMTAVKSIRRMVVGAAAPVCR